MSCLFFCFCVCCMNCASKKTLILYVKEESGYLGQRIAHVSSIDESQDVEHLVKHFRQKKRPRAGNRNFGKWIQGAIASYRYIQILSCTRLLRMEAELLMENPIAERIYR